MWRKKFKKTLEYSCKDTSRHCEDRPHPDLCTDPALEWNCTVCWSSQLSSEASKNLFAIRMCKRGDAEHRSTHWELHNSPAMFVNLMKLHTVPPQTTATQISAYRLHSGRTDRQTGITLAQSNTWKTVSVAQYEDRPLTVRWDEWNKERWWWFRTRWNDLLRRGIEHGHVHDIINCVAHAHLQHCAVIGNLGCTLSERIQLKCVL